MPEDTPPIIDYEGSDYQSTFWDQSNRQYEDRAEMTALNRLLPPGGDLLLELGAGAGRNTPRYAGYERVVLLDYSLTQLIQAQERLGKSERYVYVAGDVYHLPFKPGIYDGATMIRVLHHLVSPPRALTEIRRVMKEGSTFILEYANKQNLKAVLRYWLGKQEWDPFSTPPVEFVDLNFNFHPRYIRAELQEAQFQLERQLTVSHFRINFLKKIVPTPLLVTLDSLAQLTGDLWQLSPSVFTRSRATGTNPRPENPEDIFQCPRCGGHPLDRKEEHLVCSSCGQIYPLQDGIYDFRKFS